MIYDGQWRLAKYATGERVLFNLLNDPWEQDNLVNHPRYQKIYSRLDSLLTQEILRSQLLSYHDRLVYARDLSQEPSFGYEGWQRPYPRDIHEAL